MWRDCARRARSRMTEWHYRRRWSACLFVGAFLISACGGDGLTDAERVERRAVFVLTSAPAGLEEAVVADSIAWSPGFFRLVGDEELEIEGTFAIVFRNRATQSLELRYDLRFLDADGIFVDHFIPFGQPLLLEAGARQVGQGTFTIRSRDLAHPEWLATMQVVAAATEPAE